MNKKQFNRLLDKVTTRKRLDVSKIPELTNEERDEMVKYLVRRRAPLVWDLIPPVTDITWLHSCGYLHTTKGKRYTFLHTVEHMPAIR